MLITSVMSKTTVTFIGAVIGIVAEFCPKLQYNGMISWPNSPQNLGLTAYLTVIIANLF